MEFSEGLACTNTKKNVSSMTVEGVVSLEEWGLKKFIGGGALKEFFCVSELES